MDTKHPLTAWRDKHGITQAELAQRVNVSRWTINSIENRNRNASRDLIAALLKVSGGDLAFSDLLPDAPSEVPAPSLEAAS